VCIESASRIVVCLNWESIFKLKGWVHMSCISCLIGISENVGLENDGL